MGHSAVGSVVALDQRPLLVGRRLQQVPDQACKGWARMQGYLLEALLLELKLMQSSSEWSDCKSGQQSTSTTQPFLTMAS